MNIYKSFTFDKAKSMLESLVKIPSVSKNEEELAIFLNNWLNGIGMQSEIDRHGNVIARKKYSDDGIKFCLNTHMDTVDIYETWTKDPFGCEMEGTKMYGCGALDTKGPMAGMLMALEAIVQSDVELKGELIFTAVVCEEYPGEDNKGTVKLIRDGFSADMVLVGEPTEMKICRGCQGMTEVLIRAQGKTIHASTAESGVNAIQSMVKLINVMNARLKPGYSELLGPGSINVGVINGGTRSASVPDVCTLKVSRFVVEGESGQMFKDEIDAIINELATDDPAFNAVTELTYASLAGVIPQDHPLTDLMRRATAKALGKEAPVYGMRAHLDTDFLINMAGIPSLSFGPGNLAFAHQEDEWIDVSDIPDAAKVYAAAILDALS